MSDECKKCRKSGQWSVGWFHVLPMAGTKHKKVDRDRVEGLPIYYVGIASREGRGNGTTRSFESV